MLEQLFSTKSRIGRRAFAIAFLLLLAIRVLPVLIINILSHNYHVVFPKGFSDAFGWFMLFISTLALIVLYVHVVKRLHDLGKPDSLAILLIFPLANIGLLIYLLAKPGIVGANEYGNDPREPRLAN